MLHKINKKIKKLWKRLLKASASGKFKKAKKLEKKLIKQQLKFNNARKSNSE